MGEDRRLQVGPLSQSERAITPGCRNRNQADVRHPVATRPSTPWSHGRIADRGRPGGTAGEDRGILKNSNTDSGILIGMTSINVQVGFVKKFRFMYSSILAIFFENGLQ